MRRKTISSSVTVNCVEDGKSAPYYFQEWFAWSNVENTASSTQEPTPNSGWSETIPSRGSYAYLWKKYIKYTLNTSTNTYVAGTTQYVRLSGTNGTSINVKGTVPTVADLANISNPADGDAYVVEADRHLHMWSDEADDWVDIGQFQGTPGETWYTHIAWAEDVTLSSTELPIPDGQQTRPNATSVTGCVITPDASDEGLAWMGVLVDQESEEDAADALYYTWTYIKGEPGEPFYAMTVTNQTEAFPCNDDGEAVTDATYSTNVNLFKGGSPVSIDTIRVTYDATGDYAEADTAGPQGEVELDLSEEIGLMVAVRIVMGRISHGLPRIDFGHIEAYVTAGDPDEEIPPTDLSAPRTFTIRVTDDDGNWMEGSFSLYGIRGGMDAMIYHVHPNETVVVKKKDGTYVPAAGSNITCSVTKTQGGESSVPDASEYTLMMSRPNVSGGAEQAYQPVPVNDSFRGVTFKVYSDGIIHDTQTVGLITDGEDGESGEGAFICDLSNESASFGTDSNDMSVTAQNITTEVRLYVGTQVQELTGLSITRVSYAELPEGSSSFPTNPPVSYDTPTIGGTGNTVGTLRVRIAVSGTGQKILYGLKVIGTATCQKGTIPFEWTIRKVSSGAPGVSPTLYEIRPSMDAVTFSRGSDGVTLTPPSRNVTLTVDKIVGNEITSMTWGSTTGETTDHTIRARYKFGSMPTLSDSAYNQLTGITVNSSQTENLFVAIFNSDGKFEDGETIPILRDGSKGASGGKTAIIYLYKRGTNITAHGITSTTWYDFAQKKLYTAQQGSTVAEPNGWQQTIPSGTNPIYVIAATAYSEDSRDDIASNEWSTPVKMSEEGVAGLNSATVFLYQRYTPTTQNPTPAKPNVTLYYKFSDGKLYTNSDCTTLYSGNWKQYIPEASTHEPCFVTQATAVSNTASDAIGNNEWSDVKKLVEDGAKGDPGESAFIYDLTNEHASFGTDAVGHVLTQQVVNTDFYLYIGTQEQTLSQTATATLKYADGTPLTNTSVAQLTQPVISGTKGTVGVTIKQQSEVPVLQGMRVDITATTTGGKSKTFSFNISRVASGAAGVSPTVYELLPAPSAVSVGRDGSGSLSPTNVPVKCGYTATTGSSVTSVADASSTSKIDGKYLVYFRRHARGGSWEQNWLKYSYGIYYGYLNSPGLHVPTYDKVEFVLYDVSASVNPSNTISSSSLATSLIVDRETVPVMADGVDGVDGTTPDVYEVKTTIDSAIVPYSGTVNVQFAAELTKNGSPYICYWGLYSRLGNAYTWLRASTSTVAGQVNFTGQSGRIPVDIAEMEALVVVMSDGQQYRYNALPASYLAKKEVFLVRSGEKGIDGVSYSIVVERAVLKYDAGTGVLDCDITCYGIMNQGGTTTRLSPLDYSVYGKLDVENDWTAFGDNGTDTFDDDGSWDGWSGSTAPACMMLSLRSGGVEIATTSVAVSVVMPGHIGRFYEYAGVWKDEVTQITNTENHGWYVKYGNNFYMLITDDNVTVYCNNYSTPPDQDTARYELMTGDRQYYMAKAFFGEYAQFGGMIINGDYEFSRYGYMKGYGGTRTEITSGDFYTNADPDDMFGIGDMYIQGDPDMLMYGKNYNRPWSGTTAWESVNSTSGTIAAGWYTLEITGYTTTGIMSWQVQGGQISKTNLNTPTGNITYNSSDTTPPYDDGATSVVNFYYSGTGSITLQVKASSPLATMIVTNYYMRKCKFIPKFILNMMTGESSQEDVTARGRLLDGVSEITPTNYNGFIFHSEDKKANRLDPTAMGTTVRFTGTFTNPPIIHFPEFAGETAETKDRIRAMKGKTITIINATSSVIGLTGGAGWMPAYGTGGEAGSQTISSGGIALVDCIYDLSETWTQEESGSTTSARVRFGAEQVVWRYRFVGGTRLFNEDDVVKPWWTTQKEAWELEGHTSTEINS